MKFRKLYSLNPSHLTKFSNSEGAWATMRQLNPSLPSITVSGLRKTSEQYTDRTLKNGLITAEKAQHNWGTYRRNYAAGNPQGAKENFSAALDTLMNQGIATRALSERVKVADELGIDLRGSDEGVDLLLNGLGCRSQEPPTDIELRFIKKQKRLAGHQRLVRIFLIVSNVQKVALWKRWSLYGSCCHSGMLSSMENRCTSVRSMLWSVMKRYS
ncbi:hypothetical protein [Enterobacter kobei]|uniref:hypothetical protein n=1 Tax=Enterobacter kobei TaxID=208224 RepID=UPI003890CA4E